MSAELFRHRLSLSSCRGISEPLSSAFFSYSVHAAGISSHAATQPPNRPRQERSKSKASLNSSGLAPGFRFVRKCHTFPPTYSTSNGLDNGQDIPCTSGRACASTISSFQSCGGYEPTVYDMQRSRPRFNINTATTPCGLNANRRNGKRRPMLLIESFATRTK